MFINAHILVLKTLGNIQYAEHKWSIQEHSLAWRHKVAWPSKRMNGFDVCFPESGRVWESDSAASHAGAGAAGSSLRDAAQRLSEEAPGGRHGPQPGREWDMFMCFKHSMCVCVCPSELSMSNWTWTYRIKWKCCLVPRDFQFHYWMSQLRYHFSFPFSRVPEHHLNGCRTLQHGHPQDGETQFHLTCQLHALVRTRWPSSWLWFMMFLCNCSHKYDSTLYIQATIYILYIYY